MIITIIAAASCVISWHLVYLVVKSRGENTWALKWLVVISILNLILAGVALT